jgi:hypothetical protein
MFDNFFSGEGSNRILIYYQTQYKVTESGEIKDYGGHKEFFVTDGEKIKLKGKGVYFLRVDNEGTGDKPKAINQSGTHDDDVLFGEVSEHSVTSLNIIINQIYKPIIDKGIEWEQCSEDQKKEFIQIFDGFSGELKEALKSL